MVLKTNTFEKKIPHTAFSPFQNEAYINNSNLK